MWESTEDASDSMLDDSSGIDVGIWGVRLCGKGQRGEVDWFCGVSGAQQNVSRFHSLQLIFSSRLPSSMVPAHLEKTVT